MSSAKTVVLWHFNSQYFKVFYFLTVQALEWIHDTGEFYLSTHTSTGSSIHHTQELLKEHEDFHITAKVQQQHSDDEL